MFECSVQAAWFGLPGVEVQKVEFGRLLEGWTDG
jgi:hypothetical protein